MNRLARPDDNRLHRADVPLVLPIHPPHVGEALTHECIEPRHEHQDVVDEGVALVLDHPDGLIHQLHLTQEGGERAVHGVHLLLEPVERRRPVVELLALHGRHRDVQREAPEQRFLHPEEVLHVFRGTHIADCEGVAGRERADENRDENQRLQHAVHRTVSFSTRALRELLWLLFCSCERLPP